VNVIPSDRWTTFAMSSQDNVDVDPIHTVYNATSANQGTGTFPIVSNVSVMGMPTCANPALELAFLVETIQRELDVTGMDYMIMIKYFTK
jgi:hypothetical protein